MTDSDVFEILEIKLPKYLARWLKEYAEELAMNPSQLLVQILTPYFEVYKKGSEKCNSQTTVESSHRVIKYLPLLAEKFIEEEKLRGITTEKKYFIVRKFASWAKDKLQNVSELNDNIINTFLEEYTKAHNISKTSLNVYRNALKKFINFVQQEPKTS